MQFHVINSHQKYTTENRFCIQITQYKKGYCSSHPSSFFFSFFFLFIILVQIIIFLSQTVTMLSSTIKESSFNSTTSKQIPNVLPYGKHQNGLKQETAKKTQEDVKYKKLLSLLVLHL